MTPITSYLAGLGALLSTALALPTLEPRNTQNFTVFASSADTAVNGLVFDLYKFADGSYIGYLYDHKSIPISITNDFNLQINANSANLVTSLNSDLQVILDPSGAVTAGPQGTSGFWIEPDTDDLAFDFGTATTQDTFTACKWTGDPSANILYTVGWVDAGATPSEGCETTKLHTTF